MPEIRLDDGSVHQVTQAWWDECVAPYPGIDEDSEAGRESARLALLAGSQTLHDDGKSLSVEELALLEALTKWKNVARAWRWVKTGDRHYSEFGFQHLDQVHGNAAHHACGCITQFAFDHNLVREISYRHYEAQLEARADVTEAEARGETVSDEVRKASEERVKQALDAVNATLPPIVHHPHVPRRVCTEHLGLAGDFRKHFAALHKT